MATFTISPATSFSFRIETGTGTINDGVTLANNYLYADAATYYNCDKAGAIEYCDRRLCSDSVTFQFEYDHSTQAPAVEVYDADGNFEVALAVTEINATTNKWEATVDFSVLDCPGCYTVEVVSVLTSPNGLTTCCENGTFELPGSFTGGTTGGNNLGAVQTVSPVRTGTQSGLITADASPNAGANTVFNCSADFSLTANTYYRYKIYVYEKSTGTKFSSTEQSYKIDVTTDFADVTVISEVTANPSSDGEDTWLPVEVVFLTGSDVTGKIYLVLDSGTPQASGEVWLDDFSLEEDQVDPVVEATSEPVCLRSVWQCHQLITWTSGDNGSNQDTFGIDYSNNLINSARVEASYWNVRWTDDQFITERDSGGTAYVGSSKPREIVPFHTNVLPPWLLRKLQFAFKTDTCKINGVQYTALDGDVSPIYPDNATRLAASLLLDIFLSEFDYQNANC